MKTFYTADHHLHHSGMELSFGRIVETFEKPVRAEIVLDRVRDTGLGEILEPESYDRALIERIHTPAYLDFLETVFAEWRAAGRDCEVWPYSWRHRSMPMIDTPPSGLDARLSYYSFDMAGSITETTWQAAKRAAAGAVEVRDAVGNLLADGDQVTLIKDLEVKGAGQTLKRGTLIKSIRLTGDPQEIDCRYEGIKGLVLRAEFVRKR